MVRVDVADPFVELSLQYLTVAAFRFTWFTTADLETNTKRYISGRDGGGIGAIAVSPDGNHLAVAERAVQGELPPRVFVHNLPSLATVRILRAGTEQGYSDVSFSPDGMSVATVGDAPDFLLSVW